MVQSSESTSSGSSDDSTSSQAFFQHPPPVNSLIDGQSLLVSCEQSIFIVDVEQVELVPIMQLWIGGIPLADFPPLPLIVRSTFPVITFVTIPKGPEHIISIDVLLERPNPNETSIAKRPVPKECQDYLAFSS